MQQLQEEDVKKEILKHPNGPIEVVYEPGKTTLTRQDEKLIAAYIKIKDFEQQMKETADNLYRECKPIRNTIEELVEDLKVVKESFAASVKIADKLCEPNYTFQEASLDKLNEERDKTEDLLRDYNEKILAVYSKAKVVQDKINHYNDTQENDLDPLFDEYDKICTEHMNNWQNNSINIAHFDEQFDNFKGLRSYMETGRENLVEDCSKVMSEYTMLTLETTGVFNTWNEFVKRCGLLQVLSDLHNKATGFTEN